MQQSDVLLSGYENTNERVSLFLQKHKIYISKAVFEQIVNAQNLWHAIAMIRLVCITFLTD